jgi:2-hydroxychromene-2-carboxylate isomerase
METVDKIGPNFANELAAAGLAGQPFSWTASGELFFSEDASQDLKDSVQAVLGAHDPDTPAPPFVPQVVSRFQGREAMWQTPHVETTLFEAAEAILADPATPAMYRRAWDDLQEFRRDSEMLAAVAGMLGLTAAQTDALFILAASIQA